MVGKSAKVLEPRSYQRDLLERANVSNIIIYLPTGAGKTFVAILILKRFSNEMQKTIEEGGKRAIFMCNTIELARQQAVALKQYTNLKVGFYVGERDVDSWSHKKWDEEIKENQVFVGTAQIFVDMIAHNYIKVSNLSVVIVDECHHATGKHPMHSFMQQFQYVDQSMLPRVIGLTGVLLKNNKLSDIYKELRNLEVTLRGMIVTVSTMEQFNNVMVYSTKPHEEMICYTTNKYSFDIESKIKLHIQECFEIVDNYDIGSIPVKLTKGMANAREPSKKNSIKNLLKDFLYQMDDFGLYTADYSIMSVIIELEIKKRQAPTLTLRKLYRYLITKCEYIHHILRNKFNDLSDDDNSNADVHTLNIIMNFSTPKMQSLLMYMKSKFHGKKFEDICCLVFVERRYSAKALYYVIENFLQVTPELKEIIKPQFMIGRNSIAPGIESILDRKWNKSAIESFGTGKCNLIVCSNVLEEGIDVQDCNYVFVVDKLKSFRSYIQTKGRARSSGSTYAIFTPKNDEINYATQIKKYNEIHELIKQFLVGRVLDRDDIKEEEIAEQFVEAVQPFEIASGARLLSTMALPTLHRYCQTLPADVFGAPTPWFRKLPADGDGKEMVSLKLPLQSTVTETIISDQLKTPKQCKISAAFKACVRLYENGELNEKLLPITKRECLSKVSEELFQHWKKYNDDVTRKTTGKQQRRAYNRMCPEELYNAIPAAGEICYMHEISFQTHFEENDYNAHVKHLLGTATNYAFLLRKRLPCLAEMPLFMNQGKVTVKVSEEPHACSINDINDIEKLRNFHLMIFRDLLECWNSFYVIDNRNKDYSYLLVPLNAQHDIDWNLVYNFQRLLPQRKYGINERYNKIYRPEDYLGRVVNKWYSDIENDRFVVTKVHTNLTPLSPFIGEHMYKSFADFVETKYRDQIERVVNHQQFLIEVKALTSRRNFFINAVGKNANRDKKHGTVILIPELCHNFMYPGNMWLKALFLPSILHRIHYMLHGDTLRRQINRFLGLEHLNANYKPKPLMIDMSLQRVVDVDGNAMEKYEEPKKMLPSLPAKLQESNFEIQSLANEDATWKQYLEPQDLTRKFGEAYPVELDYYYNFISGLALDLDDLKLEEEDGWCKSQLNMPSQKKKFAAGTNSSIIQSPLPIKDTPLEVKRRIEILERSQDKLPLVSAEQYELVSALTAAGANDVFDMERFELLGDSFLKFSVSLYLMNKYPKFHEGFLTELKSKIVSNRNLLYCMLELDIPKRICSTLFKPKCEWLPPLISLPYNLLELLEQNLPVLSTVTPGDLFAMDLSEDEVVSGICSPLQLEKFVNTCSQNKNFTEGCGNIQVDSDLNTFVYKEVMPDKVVADTLEALLGVCVKNYGIHMSFQMLEFFGICRSDANIALPDLLNLKLGSPLLRTNITSAEVDGFLINYQNLEENLGYSFRDRAYLLQALTHPSFPTNRLTGCYQQLEFLGDAILDFLVSCYIFERNQNLAPGKLTDLRMALVNNATLACVCVRHRFHLFLLAENAILAESIKIFADFQETQDHRVTDQVRILMGEDMMDFNDETDVSQTKYNFSLKIDVPKALGDIVEALIAAVYLDSRDINTTWNVIYHLLEQELNDFSHNVPIDPVRQLYERTNADPKFDDAIVDNEVVMVKCTFTCLDNRLEVNGFGANSKQAKKSAAKHALQILAKHSC